MLEVADHGRVVVVYDDAEAPGEAESPNAAPEAPGEVESPRHRCEIETWSARNLSRFINICLSAIYAYLLHNSTRTAPQAGLEDTD